MKVSLKVLIYFQELFIERKRFSEKSGENFYHEKTNPEDFEESTIDNVSDETNTMLKSEEEFVKNKFFQSR